MTCWTGKSFRMLAGATMLRGLPVTAAIALALTPQIVAAREARARFDIPAQDLASALQEFARQANMQILFPYALANGRRSAPLHASLPPRRAIERLLVGHALAVTSFEPDRMTIGAARRGSARTVRPLPRSPAIPRKPDAPAPAPSATGAEITVAGRIALSGLDQTAYSYAVTTLDMTDAGRKAPASLADLLRTVPGFWVEASGGEGSNNVRSRGIPTDGFTSVALAENGLPIQYDGGLAYLNTDQSFRIDETVARLEVVRGGPSSLFMPGAPGGVANFVTRSGLREPGGLVKITAGDGGYGRLDAVYARRLSDELGLMVGGFYRRDGGRRRPGYTADEGGQARIALDFENGTSNLSVDLRHLDDRVTFYLPVPLQLDPASRVVAVAGFDPLRDALSGPETRNLPTRGPNDPALIDLKRGTTSKVTALTVRGRTRLAEEFELVAAMRWRSSDILRNGLFPNGNPQLVGDYLASIRAPTLAAYAKATNVALRYVRDGTPVAADTNGNGLVVGANLLSVHVPLNEILFDSRLAWRFRRFGQHDLALGMTLARYSYRFDRSMGSVLLDVRDGAGLVDAVATNAAGEVVGRFTDHGFQRYGSLFDRVDMSTRAMAFYLADEWQVAPRLRIDLGARWERSAITGEVTGKVAVDLGDPATLADNQVLSASGAIVPVNRSYRAFGWSGGVSYRVTDMLGLFARYTDTFRLPSTSEFNLTPQRTDQDVVPIRLAELGLKYTARRASVHATGFYTRFDRLVFTDFRFDTVANGYLERTAIAGSKTLGFELETRFRPVAGFDLTAQLTWQRARYRGFRFTQLVDGLAVQTDYTGRQLVRVPALALRLTPAIEVLGGKLRTEMSITWFSGRFADIANSQRLPGYTLVGANVRARLTERLTLSLQATNLFNAIGLTEGNPRSGSFESGAPGQKYFLARPEFARSFRMIFAAEL